MMSHHKLSEVQPAQRWWKRRQPCGSVNPNNDAYWQSRGYDERPDDWESQSDNDDDGNDDNRANQMNPNNDAYWSSRGEEQSG